MPNTYYEATGVLVLERVTPVIRALFGGFRLDANYPGNGEVYIGIRPETSPSWEDLREKLTDLAALLGFTPTPDTLTPISQVLKVLGNHFCTDGNAALESMIERDDFGDAADLKDLFLLAICFDDGHHLREIRFEGCWRCDRPRLFEFGGAGHYISREFELHSASSDALQLGPSIRNALSSNDFDSAGSAVASEVLRLLAAIRDVAHRDQVQRAAIWKLMEGLVDPGER
ncbi:hypothetical protein [Xanthomonas sp. CFBP 8445]|uniref:hypothetical protein n=1 Tax=Xanthomonas sp. CFBP 8445 TaxID=2971236 RepID=UPI0002EC2455|nr:hypothetical protein [Xanthomonas sp. CFBP 8445]UYC11856.1 hypothetical protein NUG21_19245 [Xanthomonas sp. CFBP 8445]